MPLPPGFQAPTFNFLQRLAKNFAESSLSREAEIADTTVWIPAGDTALFPQPVPPDEFFVAVIYDDRFEPELVQVTEVLPSGALTVVRGFEATGAQAWAAGARIRNVLSAGSWEELISNFAKVEEFFNFLKSAFELADADRACIKRDLVFLEDWLTEMFGPRSGGPAGNADGGVEPDTGDGGSGGVEGNVIENESISIEKLDRNARLRMEHVVGHLYHDAGIDATPMFRDPNGDVLNIVEFSELHNRLRDTWNTGGEPSGTFRLPNIAGEFLLPSGLSPQGTQRLLADAGGSETHQLIVSEMPSHVHTGSVTFNLGGSPFLTPGGDYRVTVAEVTSPAGTFPFFGEGAELDSDNNPPLAFIPITGLFTVSIDPTGGDQPHPIMPPHKVVNLRIFTGVEELLKVIANGFEIANGFQISPDGVIITGPSLTFPFALYSPLHDKGLHYIEAGFTTVEGTTEFALGIAPTGHTGEVGGPNSYAVWGRDATVLETKGNGIVGTSLPKGFTTLRVGMAVDFDNGRVWFRDDVGWINGGVPASGAFPDFTFAPTTFALALGFVQDLAPIGAPEIKIFRDREDWLYDDADIIGFKRW